MTTDPIVAALDIGTAHTTALVARDQRLLRLPLALIAGDGTLSDTARLCITDEVRAQQWLQGSPAAH